jgi:hypothetical protein
MGTSAAMDFAWGFKRGKGVQSAPFSVSGRKRGECVPNSCARRISPMFETKRPGRNRAYERLNVLSVLLRQQRPSFAEL